MPCQPSPELQPSHTLPPLEKRFTFFLSSQLQEETTGCFLSEKHVAEKGRQEPRALGASPMADGGSVALENQIAPLGTTARAFVHFAPTQGGQNAT